MIDEKMIVVGLIDQCFAAHLTTTHKFCLQQRERMTQCFPLWNHTVVKTEIHDISSISVWSVPDRPLILAFPQSRKLFTSKLKAAECTAWRSVNAASDDTQIGTIFSVLHDDVSGWPSFYSPSSFGVLIKCWWTKAVGLLFPQRALPLPRGRWWRWRRGRQTMRRRVMPVTTATRESTHPGRTPWWVGIPACISATKIWLKIRLIKKIRRSSKVLVCFPYKTRRENSRSLGINRLFILIK